MNFYNAQGMVERENVAHYWNFIKAQCQIKDFVFVLNSLTFTIDSQSFAIFANDFFTIWLMIYSLLLGWWQSICVDSQFVVAFPW